MKTFKFWKVFKEIDLFGKEPDIYYKGKQRKTSWMGRICTWIYVVIYVFFFIYKLVRMFQRLDVSFSETNSSIGGLPKIHLTKEIFLYSFALLDDKQNPYIDTSIYFPVAKLATTKTINGEKVTNTSDLDIGPCEIDDFGKNYQKYASRYNVSNFYCFKNFDVEFEGYSSAENSTTIVLIINKCIPGLGLPCKDPDIVEKSLNNHSLLIFSEDFDITPYDFSHPVKEKLNVNTCPIDLAQYQQFVGYYQLTNIETDYNLIGFEALADIKSEKYLIYHSALIMQTEMPQNQPMAIQYNIMLTEKVLTNQRKYTQLIDVLGDVGGLMEVVESIFGVICTLVADILYDKTMVNNLFSFDLEDNMIQIKNKKIKYIHNINKITVNDDNSNFNKKTLDIPCKIFKKNEEEINPKKDSIKPNLNTKKTLNASNNSSNMNNIISSERTPYLKNKSFKTQKSLFSSVKNMEEYNGLDIKVHDIKIFDSDRDKSDKPLPRKRILKKLDANIFCTYFCFCCSRKRKNIANTLLDEAMSIITEKLDIYNMFRNMYYIDDLKQLKNYEYKDREFSEECKRQLKEISHKIYNSFYEF